MFVAEDESGRVCVYAVSRRPGDGTKDSVEEGEAELKELYVDPDWGGAGIGTELLGAGTAALPVTVDSLVLGALEGNDIAPGFYEARGFERTGTSTFEIAGEQYPTRVYRKPL